MKYVAALFALLSWTLAFTQIKETAFETFPVFTPCEEVAPEALENCFYTELRHYIYQNFNTPSIVSKESYKGEFNVFFEVTVSGSFRVLYVDAPYQELKDEAKRVFESLAPVKPATYGGNHTFVQFSIQVDLSLLVSSQNMVVRGISQRVNNQAYSSEDVVNEYDAIKKVPFSEPQYTSDMNIPLSHQEYMRFDAAMNRVGTNNHTAQKPYVFSEVNRYYNFQSAKKALKFNKSSWFGRKFWNENMVRLQGEAYWLTLDPGVDLQAGKDSRDDIQTYNNTRLMSLQGGLGKQLSFAAVVYESQGRFAGYFNRLAEARAPTDGSPAIIAGQGIAKRFRTDSFDYPVATGYISYSPSKWFNAQLGHGKNFIGDGYRSLLLSDNASSYPFIKLNTTFWKLKYTNTWMSLRDVRPEVNEGGSFRTKFVANHYLSYNITKRLNVGFFESVVWQNDNDRGFDFNYINPIIFYRAIEFSTGSGGGNAIIGLSAKYKFTDHVYSYGQFVIDEFSSRAVFEGNGGFQNKTGYQLGLKYFEPFKVNNLMVQIEYNRVRPYTYSHNTIVLNYGHNNQSLAHPFGANFEEFIGIIRYQNKRVFGDFKIIAAQRGLEFDSETDAQFYGGDIYGGGVRPSNDGNELAQGNTADFFHTEVQGGYVINPTTNLKIYASLIYRKLDTAVQQTNFFDENTTWVNFGVRTDLFNWYYDF